VKKVCVYCGSSPGLGDAYISAARLLGSELAKREICLVYGGGRNGVMGEIASAAFREGGEVIGVIPKDLAEKEMASPELSDLIVVPSMHDRKAMMIELADAFIALPGGFGTLEEFFEVLTWAQLGIHQKPCGLLNVDGYYDRLTNFLDHVEEAQFVPSAHRAMIMIDDDPAGLLKRLEKYKSIEVDKATWAKGFSGK
jgi:uncharacterized protein (TIGR00730 family)